MAEIPVYTPFSGRIFCILLPFTTMVALELSLADRPINPGGVLTFYRWQQYGKSGMNSHKSGIVFSRIAVQIVHLPTGKGHSFPESPEKRMVFRQAEWNRGILPL